MQQPETMPQISYLELSLSFVAILIFGTMIGVLVGSLVWLVFDLMAGRHAMMMVLENIRAQVPDKTGIMSALVYSVTAAFYAAFFVTMWVVAKFGVNAPLKLRVAFHDWYGDNQFWWLALVIAPAVNILSSLVLGAVDPQAGNQPPTPTSLSGWLMLFAVAVVIAPICEEMLFRGWLFTALRTRKAFGTTAMITAGLFAFMHILSGAYYAMLIFPVGLLLAYARERYGSIKPTIVIHGLFNASALLLAYMTAKP
ncbi:MAG: CPBP family intramembrane metalloprotease [Hyphomicrobiales bacterium]|nr:CPBP family intramembrane metalloprotease [Hyphomicrobiales bacterium]